MRDQDTVENEEKGTDGVRAVDRALAVLLAFTANDDELSAVEIARRVGLSRPTLYRLLYTLERRGFIVSVAEPERFRLGGQSPDWRMPGLSPSVDSGGVRGGVWR